MMEETKEKKKTHTSIAGLLAGGFFIVLPLLLVVLVLQQIFSALQEVIRPLVDALPGKILQHRSVRFLVISLVFVVLMVLVGWVARTRLGQAIGRWLEAKILKHVPFYSLLRNLSSGLAASDDEKSLKPVLVTVDVPGLQQLGFIVERYADGSATVFLPSTPNPSSGTVVVVEPARLRELRVPAKQVFKCLGRWGDGTAALLEMAQEVEKSAEK